MSETDSPAGSVWLVGAGPGDPELLTRKAERLLRSADIDFHDALVGPDILALAARCARLISVGKRSGRHSMDQQTINRRLVEAAAAGHRVVRLKGGDPSIFGRSAEEVAALSEMGIMVRICAGVTAASAAAASASLSLIAGRFHADGWRSRSPIRRSRQVCDRSRCRRWRWCPVCNYPCRGKRRRTRHRNNRG